MVRKTKNFSVGATIIPIMIVSDKTIMSLSHRNQILWPVYVTINNLDTKMLRSQYYLNILLLDSISIVYERMEDLNNKDKDLKARVYHLALKTMLKYI